MSLVYKEVEIPKDEQFRFLCKTMRLGDAAKTAMVKCHQVNHDKYRINVWTRESTEGIMIPRNKITNSYYVSYDGKTITDCTKHSDEIEHKKKAD